MREQSNTQCHVNVMRRGYVQIPGIRGEASKHVVPHACNDNRGTVEARAFKLPRKLAANTTVTQCPPRTATAAGTYARVAG